uniref:hypothetical protein n=1 Tax=Thomasclavelia cocleata TaxID=69824 RepID=UPI00256EFB78
IIFSTIVMFCISREKSSDLLKKSKILFVIISILTIGIIRQLNIKVHLFEKINESFLICSYISIILTIIVFYIKNASPRLAFLFIIASQILLL